MRHQSLLSRDAERLAIHVLSGDPELLAHVRTAAQTARQAAHVLLGPEADVVVAAAWLHDIGRANALHATGFHPLDGAAYLEHRSWPNDVVCLVAHHSYAMLVAPYLDLADDLDRYRAPVGLPADILVLADLASGPDGRGMTVQERLASLRRMQGPASVPPEVREYRLRCLSDASARVLGQLSLTGRSVHRRRDAPSDS